MNPVADGRCQLGDPCGRHRKRLMAWVADQDDIAARRDARFHEQRMRQMEELTRRRIRLDRKRIAAAARAKSPYSVVYYVRRASDGAVKIGYTASIGTRMATLRVSRNTARERDLDRRP